MAASADDTLGGLPGMGAIPGGFTGSSAANSSANLTLGGVNVTGGGGAASWLPWAVAGVIGLAYILKGR